MENYANSTRGLTNFSLVPREFISVSEIHDLWGWSRARIIRYEKRSWIHRCLIDGKTKWFRRCEVEELVEKLAKTPARKLAQMDQGA